ncbi:MAG: radical SAM protein [Anaerolineaceae bacterium]|jgi:radical SAM protein with 4Fe4S-binding SPASM domain|nr:MAG: radical SAM protein [Anaerolineaceae bacterium]
MLFAKKDLTHFAEPGIYHYLRSAGENKKRIHLRIDPDGYATLLVNASRIFHFNPSASLMAKAYLDEASDQEAIQGLVRTFRVNKDQAARDYNSFKEQLELIVSPTSDVCPFCDLNVEIQAPFSKQPSAPYRMDLALTYACNNDCAHCYNVKQRDLTPLSLEEWQQVLQQVWDAGIPHVVFTGGEPTLVKFLPQLIQYAEQLGLITGLNTNGRNLKEKAYVQELLDAGLDHMQITLESHDAGIHDRMVNHAGAWQETVQGIRNVLATRLYVMTNTTLIRSNSAHLSETLVFLAELGIPTIGLNGIIHSGRGKLFEEELDESELPALLTTAQEMTARNGQQLIWYTPTQYCHFDPILMGLGAKGCTAALYNMCIEPNGDVLPCQSYYSALGNILQQDWQSIWEHDLAVSIREKRFLPADCRQCSILDTCGGGCPLAVSGKSAVDPHYAVQV